VHGSRLWQLGVCLVCISSQSQNGHVQFRPEARESAFPELREKLPIVSWRQHVELVTHRDSVPLQPLVQPLEMRDSKLMLLHILRRRIADLLISLDFDDENAIALLDEEVGAEWKSTTVLLSSYAFWRFSAMMRWNSALIAMAPPSGEMRCSTPR
jgi:hypothetical protein